MRFFCSLLVVVVAGCATMPAAPEADGDDVIAGLTLGQARQLVQSTVPSATDIHLRDTSKGFVLARFRLSRPHRGRNGGVATLHPSGRDAWELESVRFSIDGVFVDDATSDSDARLLIAATNPALGRLDSISGVSRFELTYRSGVEEECSISVSARIDDGVVSVGEQQRKSPFCDDPYGPN